MTDIQRHKKILIVKPSSLGDILHTFPAISLLAEACPDACIDWLVNRQFSFLPKFHPAVADTIIFPRKELAQPFLFPKFFLSLKKRIRRGKYDLVIDFQGLMRSSIFAKLSKAPIVAGFASPREKIATLFYNKKVSVPERYVHAVERNLFLVSETMDIEYKAPSLSLKTLNSERESVLDKLKDLGISESDTLIGISPVTRWETKNWPPEFFANIIDIIGEKKVKFIIIGAEKDILVANRIIAESKNKNIVSLAGRTTVSELFELIRLFKMLLSNDSGPSHIAAVLNIPVLCMFGPTVPEKTGPFGDVHYNFTAETECVGCLKRVCPKGNCVCHGSIKPEVVADAVLNLI